MWRIVYCVLCTGCTPLSFPVEKVTLSCAMHAKFENIWWTTRCDRFCFSRWKFWELLDDLPLSNNRKKKKRKKNSSPWNEFSILKSQTEYFAEKKNSSSNRQSYINTLYGRVWVWHVISLCFCEIESDVYWQHSFGANKFIFACDFRAYHPIQLTYMSVSLAAFTFFFFFCFFHGKRISIRTYILMQNYEFPSRVKNHLIAPFEHFQ